MEGCISQIDIEVQDQFGSWHHFTSVSNNGPVIKQALRNALRSPLGRKSGKARAVEIDSGYIVDIEQE